MNKFVITDGDRLTGEVVVSGAKNAVITIIPAAIMTDDIYRIENIPSIAGATAITRILYDMGVKIRKIDSSTIETDSRSARICVVPYELARHIRGSYYLLGALLGRFRHMVVSMPGGCDFGVCPIDQCLKGFGALGVAHTLEGGMVDTSVKELIRNNIYMNVVSVGATVDIMLVAIWARGTTVTENAVKEPHTVDLANFLNSMGTDVRGVGTDVIKIYGVRHLKGTTYPTIPDQTEAGTYMAVAAATGGDMLIGNVIPKHPESISTKLEEMGVTVEGCDDSIRVRRSRPLSRCSIKTMPHPGFPIDMQPQIAVVLSIAHGTSTTSESVWDNRFHYMGELKRTSAQIPVDGKLTVVEGVDHLNATPVRTTDLRAGATMLIAVLCAYGVSQVEDIQRAERGYEDVEKKSPALGVDIKRIHVLGPSVAQAV